MKSNKKGMLGFIAEVSKNRVMFLMLLPIFLYLIIFCYLPMPGVYIAFVRYNYASGIFKSPFIGLENFKFLVINGDLWNITKNTILYNLVFIGIGHLMQISIAIMLSEVRNKYFKKFSQSVMLFPYFISFVIVGVFAYNMFNYNYGMVNNLLVQLGHTKHDFYADKGIWKFIITFFYIWKGTGYGMIIYLATITGINPQLYEAAKVEGANVFQKLRYITLPLIKPTFVLLVLFGLGGILRGQFDLFYNLIGNNSILFSQTDIIDTYVFRSLVGQFNFSISSAVGFYQSAFGLVMVLLVNFIIRKIEPEYALF